jgi:hypothetical protein
VPAEAWEPHSAEAWKYSAVNPFDAAVQKRLSAAYRSFRKINHFGLSAFHIAGNTFGTSW